METELSDYTISPDSITFDAAIKACLNSSMMTSSNTNISSPYITTTGTYGWDMNNENVETEKFVELMDIHDRRYILKVISYDKDSISNIIEKKMSRFVFDRRFPFIKKESDVYVEFQYEDKKIHTAKCSLSSFMRIIGREYDSFAKNQINNMLENGE